MSARTTTLDNGLTVVSHNMAHVETVSLGMWTRAGARDEADNENGLAHLLEHMAFKGTKNRSAFEIAVEIEAAGGDMNASTSMETTAYYARVLRNDWQLALDVISDIVMNPVFAADDLALEKGVILQEIAAAQDTPDDLVFDLVQNLAWPDHSLGRDILGTPETVKKFSADNLAAYRAKHYTGSRMVLSAAGRIDHDALVQAASERLSGIEHGEGTSRTTPDYAGGDAARKRPLDQVHQVMAFSTPGYYDDDVYGIHLLASILGGGMSSRLFQEVRERRGLCYSTFAHVSAFADTGLDAGICRYGTGHGSRVLQGGNRRAAGKYTGHRTSRTRSCTRTTQGFAGDEPGKPVLARRPDCTPVPRLWQGARSCRHSCQGRCGYH